MHSPILLLKFRHAIQTIFCTSGIILHVRCLNGLGHSTSLLRGHSNTAYLERGDIMYLSTSQYIKDDDDDDDLGCDIEEVCTGTVDIITWITLSCRCCGIENISGEAKLCSGSHPDNWKETEPEQVLQRYDIKAIEAIVARDGKAKIEQDDGSGNGLLFPLGMMSCPAGHLVGYSQNTMYTCLKCEGGDSVCTCERCIDSECSCTRFGDAGCLAEHCVCQPYKDCRPN